MAAVKPSDKSGYRVGIDVGGTFTDLVLVSNDGNVEVRKTLSTPDDYGRGVVKGLTSALDELGLVAGSIDRVVHATTVATNTVLENKGARTALITTRGFRDVLEMRRLRIPDMYSLNFPRPEPMAPRRWRLEVTERMGPKGEIRTALDEESVASALEQLSGQGIEAVAVSLLHAYANPVHEQRVAAMVREMLGEGVYITCSSEILPEIREYERTSTTVVNAYLGPVLERYFSSLVSNLERIGIRAPLQVMKSDGSIMTVATAVRKPAYLVESGPAAGVIGAARAGEPGHMVDLVTLDMGGTTAKASIVEDGRVGTTSDYEVGAGINLSSRLVSGGGYALKLPVVDLSEIGAGGGSLVTVDAGGLMHVGPKSAGAMPGPVAYDMGGKIPTFTDAMIMLGYINAGYLVGGGLRLNADAARNALDQHVVKPLNSGLLETAYGIYRIAGSTMVRAVKAVSTYRGRDPRDFSLFAFGGNGPVVATEIATQLEMTRILVPLNPGVFSAFGLLLSDIEHEFSRAFLGRLQELDLEEICALYGELEEDARSVMAEGGFVGETVALRRAIDLRYTEQAHELTIPYIDDVSRLADSFSDAHARMFGHEASADSVESVAVRVKAIVPVDRIERRTMENEDVYTQDVRQAYFGPDAGLHETPVIGRRLLMDGPRPGPVIVEEYDATCVVPPGWLARLDRQGNIELVLD